MTEPADGPDPTERLEDLPRILEAMRAAVREALRRHKEAGNPVAVWRNGRVEWVAPKDIPVAAESSSPRSGRMDLEQMDEGEARSQR